MMSYVYTLMMKSALKSFFRDLDKFSIGKMHIPSLQSTNAQVRVAVVFLQIFYLNVIQQRRNFFNDRLLVVAIFEKRISQNLIDESTYISKRTYFINNTNKLSGTLKK